MIFLLHYDRKASQLISIKTFEHSERAAAAAERVDLEIRSMGISDGSEVVLLEADSKVELQKTHSRYFNSMDGLRRNAARTEGRADVG